MAIPFFPPEGISAPHRIPPIGSPIPLSILSELECQNSTIIDVISLRCHAPSCKRRIPVSFSVRLLQHSNDFPRNFMPQDPKAAPITCLIHHISFLHGLEPQFYPLASPDRSTFPCGGSLLFPNHEPRIALPHVLRVVGGLNRHRGVM